MSTDNPTPGGPTPGSDAESSGDLPGGADDFVPWFGGDDAPPLEPPDLDWPEEMPGEQHVPDPDRSRDTAAAFGGDTGAGAQDNPEHIGVATEITQTADGSAADAVPQSFVDAAVSKRLRREADQVADALFAERLTRNCTSCSSMPPAARSMRN